MDRQIYWRRERPEATAFPKVVLIQVGGDEGLSHEGVGQEDKAEWGEGHGWTGGSQELWSRTWRWTECELREGGVHRDSQLTLGLSEWPVGK